MRPQCEDESSTGEFYCTLKKGHAGGHFAHDQSGALIASWPQAESVDMVSHPPHYTTGKIECIDFIEDQRFGYLDGQVIKYVTRARHKGSAKQDYEKARFYLNRLIEQADK